MRTSSLVIVAFSLASCASNRADENPAVIPERPSRVSEARPLTIGETFTIDSAIMGESRRVNVLVPSVYGQTPEAPMPVLYMLDGGIDEDFLHVAGLVQILVSNGGMRPFMLVGIANTQRRRDMTGPTSSDEDRKIAPVVGGSATFRRFIREELMPAVGARYRTTGEAAIIGESLAGLFVLETFFLEPDLFSTCIAIDPSLWWADEELLKSARAHLGAAPAHRRSLFIASSSEPAMLALTGRMADSFDSDLANGVAFHYAPLPAETHATIYHPAALLAFRTVFSSPGAAAGE